MIERPVLGIDIGATSVKGALRSGEDGGFRTFICPARGQPLKALGEIVRDAGSLCGDGTVWVAVTGVGRELVETVCAVPSENEIIATVRGAGLLCADASNLIEVGGQFTKWIQVERDGTVADYSMNDLCAAGSGSFLEQQASRLGISVEELARLAAQAPRGATIAGRCSVFAKSDMIHLQQKGTPLDELAYGLCLAMARNFVATVLRGRSVRAPVAFIGGGAANAGLARALREVLGLSAEELFVPDKFQHFGAAGACLVAENSAASVDLQQFAKALSSGHARVEMRRTAPLPALAVSPGQAPRDEPQGAGQGVVKAFLGADVGSVSTDLCLVTEDGEVVDSVYLATRGRPVEVLKDGLEQIRGRYGERLCLLGVGTTGSGRHLGGVFLGADVVKNEITAQLTSAVAYFPQVDTIFEIGGQDSKFISALHGQVRDFTMNKVCAAGTGSFLEEQSERLGIQIVGEFAALALAGSAPVDLGNRCTVFMDSELTFAQQRGCPVENIAAGLAYAIARNYLERVAVGRQIGQFIVFQGGVASNQAVVAAFRELLGRQIRVHPYNRISGAIGAALLAQSAYIENPAPSRFRGFDACRDYAVTSFECESCSNRCQVNRFAIGDRTVFFGDACERYSGSEEKTAADSALPDLFGERERRLRLEIQTPARPPLRGRMGIPRAALFHELLPFWTRFFQRLGYEVVLSSPTSSPLLAKGLRALPVETCLPIKVTFGHVLDLIDKVVDYVFLPSVCQLPSLVAGDHLAAPCMYGEHLPHMVQTAGPTQVVAPRVSLEEDAENVSAALQGLADALGVGRSEVREAFVLSREGYEAFVRGLEEHGRGILSSDFDRAFVVLGRPYALYDPFQNLNLSRHLRRLGVLAIPMSFLPLSEVALGDEWNELVWKFSRDCVRAAEIIQNDNRLFPIVLSSFGCGPDGFAVRHLETLFEGRPHLFLEFDEHRGEAGLITRLEAFADEVETYQRTRTHIQKVRAPLQQPGSLRTGNTVFLPRFADHAYAFSGAFRAAGYGAHVLPPPDEAAKTAGQEFSTGRECHPYVLMAGDLAALARSGRARDGDVFFLPGSTYFPCLFSQFRSGYRRLLRELGVRGIDVKMMIMGEIIKLFDLAGTMRLWQGLLAIDFLVKMVCEKRPYEVHAGETDRVHQGNLRDIEEGLAARRLVEAVERSVHRMAAIPIREDGPRPVIGVAGDAYTRINAFSNDNLFDRLEEMGCEVWPAPFLVDAVDFVLGRGLRRSITNRRFGNALGEALLVLLKEFAKGRVRRSFSGALRALDEPDYSEVVRLAAPYADADTNSVVLLNIAKMVDFIHKGTDGVINAMGFNCMVGTISAALLGRIRAAHDNIPIVNLVYGEVDGTAQRSRLEAFVHQVKVHADRKRADAKA